VIAVALALAPPAAGVAATGCTPPAVPTNVIAAAEVVVETATTVIADAQAVWPIVLAAVPAAQQPAAQDAFNKAVFAANHAVLALDDAIQVAIAADLSHPDFTAIIGQVADAVAQVVSIVQSFHGPLTAEHVLRAQPSGVDAVADMAAASARLKAASAKK
jgi:hypothetical protein